MERVVYAKDLYYDIKKSKNNFKLEFIVAYGKTAYKINNSERIFVGEDLCGVWEENELGNYDLNLPEKAFNAYKKDTIKLFEMLPHFMSKQDFINCKIDINKLKTFEKELNKKIFAESKNEVAIPSWMNANITVQSTENGYKVLEAEM